MNQPDVEASPTQLLTIPEVCSHLRLGRTSVFRLLAEGDLPSVRIGKRRLVSSEALDQYVRALASDEGEELEGTA